MLRTKGTIPNTNITVALLRLLHYSLDEDEHKNIRTRGINPRADVSVDTPMPPVVNEECCLVIAKLKCMWLCVIVWQWGNCLP